MKHMRVLVLYRCRWCWCVWSTPMREQRWGMDSVPPRAHQSKWPVTKAAARKGANTVGTRFTASACHTQNRAIWRALRARICHRRLQQPMLLYKSGSTCRLHIKIGGKSRMTWRVPCGERWRGGSSIHQTNLMKILPWKWGSRRQNPRNRRRLHQVAQVMMIMATIVMTMAATTMAMLGPQLAVVDIARLPTRATHHKEVQGWNGQWNTTSKWSKGNRAMSSHAKEAYSRRWGQTRPPHYRGMDDVQHSRGVHVLNSIR